MFTEEIEIYNLYLILVLLLIVLKCYIFCFNFYVIFVLASNKFILCQICTKKVNRLGDVKFVKFN